MPLLLECCAEIILITKNTYSLQRCRVGNKAEISTVPEEFEAAAALFLWLGLLSTLICHENGAFPKTFFKQPELGNTGFSICCGWKTSEHCYIDLSAIVKKSKTEFVFLLVYMYSLISLLSFSVPVVS